MVGGVIADRVNRRVLMIVCDLARAFLVITIPVAQLLGVLTIEQIIIVGFVMTCFRAFFFPANQASVPLLLEKHSNLNQINAYMGSTSNLGAMMGPSLGGVLLIFSLSVPQLLYISTTTFMISALCIFFIKFPKVGTVDKRNKILQDAWQGLRFMITEDKGITIMIIAFAAQLLIGAGLTQLGIPKLLESLHLSGERVFGFILGAITLSGAISSILFAQIKVKRPVIWIFSGYGLRCISFVFFAFSHGLTSLIIAAVILGCSYTISGTTLTTVLQLRSPHDMLGKVMAVRSSIGNITDAFAYLLVGGILTWFSLSTAFIVMSFYSLLATLLCIVWWKNYMKNKQKYFMEVNNTF